MSGATTIIRGTSLKLVKISRSLVLRLVTWSGDFMVSLPNVPEPRWFVVAPTSKVPGWKTWCKTLTMFGTRTRRWRNLQRPSLKCWRPENVLSTSTLSFVSWMPSHK